MYVYKLRWILKRGLGVWESTGSIFGNNENKLEIITKWGKLI